MPRGSSSSSGPAPDPTALRRDRSSDAAGWVTLPASGCVETAPAWPLDPLPSDRESTLWDQMWEKPQAVQWTADHLVFEVAMYVRRLSEAEKPESIVGLSVLVRQMGDSLGLTESGMRSNRWRIGEVDGKPPTGRKPKRRTGGRSSRDRLEVISGGRQ